MNDQFAYCLAAAHLRLAHQIAASFMVSDTASGAQSEGWSYIDNLDDSEVCQVENPDNLPYVFHFCQRYAVGYWFFGKYVLVSTDLRIRVGVVLFSVLMSSVLRQVSITKGLPQLRAPALSRATRDLYGSCRG
jgi:hypothetical protein